MTSPERQALLHSNAEEPQRSESAIGFNFWQWPILPFPALAKFWFNNPIIPCTFLLQFCTYFAKHVVEVPTIKLFEQAICNRHYNIHDDFLFTSVDERRCKIPAVQDELAILTGLKFTFDALPGFQNNPISLPHGRID